MGAPLAGVHVLDMSEFGFVPSAAAVLGDWGADVVKVERPGGDPLRAHDRMGMVRGTPDFSVLIEHFNRNKRGVVLDVNMSEGRAALDRLLAWADVFITNFLPKTLRKLALTADEVQARFPRLVYVRGTGQGSRGPDAERPGFDGNSWWARGGVAQVLSPPGAFARMRPALGDGPTGMMLAGGVAAALFERERTGRGTVVEASLLHGAMWTLAPDLTSTAVVGEEPSFAPPTTQLGPLIGAYLTGDQRWLQLTMPDERWWGPACRALGLAELVDDPRYRDSDARAARTDELRARFGAVIGGRPLVELEAALQREGCSFARFASLTDVLADPQVEANGYTQPHPRHAAARVVTSPVQFGGEPATIRVGAPGVGAHTAEVLAEAGLDRGEIDALLAAGAAVQA
ncbi:MAG TPA: CoA transferase [Acidimicrobiales bacterium]|nr:CoA transferase [Acidimicrobiales bacterium]